MAFASPSARLDNRIVSSVQSGEVFEQIIARHKFRLAEAVGARCHRSEAIVERPAGSTKVPKRFTESVEIDPNLTTAMR